MPDPTPAPESWWTRNKAVVYTGLLIASWVVSVVLALRKGEAPPPPPVFQPDPPPGQGWYDDPDAVRAVVATLAVPEFWQTPAFRSDAEPDRVYLWEAAKKVLGKHIPTRNQGSVGSCVAFGAAGAGEYLQCVQIAAGTPGQFRDLAQEVVYAGSRVEVGGGRIRGDGSVGAWAAEWCRKWGVVARGTYGPHDLTAYSEERCRAWGRTGVPADLEVVARERPVKAIALVKTTGELKKALANGYPVTIASTVGFNTVRDRDGFLKAQGTWAHQMFCCGYRSDRPGFFIMNSWGENWVTGPAGPGNPPPGGFWADERTVQRMLDAGDSWAFSDLIAFPARKLDWFIVAPFTNPIALEKRLLWNAVLTR